MMDEMESSEDEEEIGKEEQRWKGDEGEET